MMFFVVYDLSIRFVNVECVIDGRIIFWCIFSKLYDMVKYIWIRMRVRRLWGLGVFFVFGVYGLLKGRGFNLLL